MRTNQTEYVPYNIPQTGTQMDKCEGCVSSFKSATNKSVIQTDIGRHHIMYVGPYRASISEIVVPGGK